MPHSTPSFFSMRFVSHLIFNMCVAFTEGEQIGNKLRLEKLYLGTSSSYCSQMSHPTPRENSNNVIVWFPFQALCIFMYAKEFSKPSNWHSNRKTSFRAQVYKQTNSFCAGKLIPHNSKLPAARWTGRRVDRAHICQVDGADGDHLFSPSSRVRNRYCHPELSLSSHTEHSDLLKADVVTLWIFCFVLWFRKEGRKKRNERKQ